jgi:hypothetical protein
VLAALAVAAVVLFVAGIHRNDQVSRLRQQGVPVTFTVTSCVGQMGGSGSNVAGYRCSGTFALGGRQYHEGLPGNSFYTPGETVPAIVVPNDPALVAPARTVTARHPTATVFIAPSVLTVIVVASLAALVWRRRDRRHASGAAGLPVATP